MTWEHAAIMTALAALIGSAGYTLWRANRLMGRVENLLKSHPPHTHNPDGSITFDPEWPPGITQAHRGHS